MRWVIPVVIGLKILHDILKEGAPNSKPTHDVGIEERGIFGGQKVLVVGRTGAGKSSLINLLKGDSILPVGEIASTTRWLQGIPITLNGREITFVDSPGIGEILTNDDYRRGIVEWYRRNQSSVERILLVLQADTKGHADDLRMLDELYAVSRKSKLIALNQVDKVNPVREELQNDSWGEESCRMASSAKVANINDKMREVARQFGVLVEQIIPVVSRPGIEFNRESLVRVFRS